MRTIIVDDEQIMLNSFLRLSQGIEDLQVTGEFTKPAEALAFVRKHPVELVFLDVKMPGMSGVELAEKLRRIRPDILIVFVSAYDEYVRDFNRVGGDYYIVKPYKSETLETAMERLRFLAKRQRKDIWIRMFGRFNIFVSGRPVPLRGKASEIMALIVSRRGKEISNEEIYRTIWENRAYSNEKMAVYYNAIGRLRRRLAEAGLSDLLLSTPHGQMANTAIFDCDYYDWLDGKNVRECRFEGEFLPEYSWGEYILGGIVDKLIES